MCSVALLHLIFAFVGVRGEMPHVCNVLDVAHVVPLGFEHASKEIDEDVGAQVADVRIVVDR